MAYPAGPLPERVGPSRGPESHIARTNTHVSVTLVLTVPRRHRPMDPARNGCRASRDKHTTHAAGAPSESGVTFGYVAYLHITSVGLIARAQPGVEGRHVHRTRTRRRTRWAASRGSEQVDHLIVPITSGGSTTATFLFGPAIPSVDIDEMLLLRGARL